MSPEQNTEAKSERKVRRGRVVSNKMDKTIVVETQRVRQHPLYEKYLRRHSRLKAHDENEVANEGDWVEIVESRPLSKSKRWKLVRVLETAKEVIDIDTSEPEEAIGAEET